MTPGGIRPMAKGKKNRRTRRCYHQMVRENVNGITFVCVKCGHKETGCMHLGKKKCGSPLFAVCLICGGIVPKMAAIIKAVRTEQIEEIHQTNTRRDCAHTFRPFTNGQLICCKCNSIADCPHENTVHDRDSCFCQDCQMEISKFH